MYSKPNVLFQAKTCLPFYCYGFFRLAPSHNHLVDIKSARIGVNSIGHLYYLAAIAQRQNPKHPPLVNIVGGSSYAAHVPPITITKIFRDVAESLDIEHGFLILHFGRSGRVDFHFLCLNADAKGRPLIHTLTAFRKRFRRAMRHYVAEYNVVRLSAGEHSIGNIAPSGRAFFVEQPEPAPELAPTYLPAPASRLVPAAGAVIAPARPPPTEGRAAEPEHAGPKTPLPASGNEDAPEYAPNGVVALLELAESAHGSHTPPQRGTAEPSSEAQPAPHVDENNPTPDAAGTPAPSEVILPETDTDLALPAAPRDLTPTISAQLPPPNAGHVPATVDAIEPGSESAPVAGNPTATTVLLDLNLRNKPAPQPASSTESAAAVVDDKHSASLEPTSVPVLTLPSMLPPSNDPLFLAAEPVIKTKHETNPDCNAAVVTSYTRSLIPPAPASAPAVAQLPRPIQPPLTPAMALPATATVARAYAAATPTSQKLTPPTLSTPVSATAERPKPIVASPTSTVAGPETSSAHDPQLEDKVTPTPRLLSTTAQPTMRPLTRPGAAPNVAPPSLAPSAPAPAFGLPYFGSTMDASHHAEIERKRKVAQAAEAKAKAEAAVIDAALKAARAAFDWPEQVRLLREFDRHYKARLHQAPGPAWAPWLSWLYLATRRAPVRPGPTLLELLRQIRNQALPAAADFFTTFERQYGPWLLQPEAMPAAVSVIRAVDWEAQVRQLYHEPDARRAATLESTVGTSWDSLLAVYPKAGIEPPTVRALTEWSLQLDPANGNIAEFLQILDAAVSVESDRKAKFPSDRALDRSHDP